MENVGKRFEEDFSKSIPSDYYVHRLRDSAQSYNKNKKTKFCWRNECDFFIYRYPLLFAIECKTTKSKSMSVQLTDDKDENKIIKYHQIESLKKISKHDGMIPGFFLNFRHFEGEENYFETTYFQHINDFLYMMNKINKKSFNEIDLLTIGKAIKINGHKKRTRWSWDIEEFLKSQYNNA